MGKTAFGGPLYGAKSVLFCATMSAVSSGASTIAFAKTIVPSGERWYITEVHGFCSTNSSGAQILVKAKGGSTSADFPTGTAGTLATITSGASTAGFSSLTILTPTAGEYEGRAVTENSSIRMVSTSVNPMSNVCVTLHGFRRWISSTRAE